MAWLDDIKTVLVAAGIPTASVFKSSSAVIPPGGPYISIVSTGGSSPERTHNLAGDAYLRPTAQIMARGPSYDGAAVLLRTAYDALTIVQNATINGVWYVSIRPLQSDFIDLNPEDGTGRARVAFNVLGDRRP